MANKSKWLIPTEDPIKNASRPAMWTNKDGTQSPVYGAGKDVATYAPNYNDQNAPVALPSKQYDNSFSFLRPKTEVVGGGNNPPVEDPMAKYINPATGQQYTPAEYTAKLRNALPLGKDQGDIPTYAGDTLTQGKQTAAQLQNTAAGLNNAANDIATGTTDPYDITKGGIITYSPEERRAIQKAYAGIYDPAINSALSKLSDMEKRDAERFTTDENIRQYNATTGKAGVASTIPRGEDMYVDPQAYLAKAKASPDIKKFLNDNPPELYINPESYSLLPPTWQPKTASQDKGDVDIANAGIYYDWLDQPQDADPNKLNSELSNKEKAKALRSLNLDPVKFNLMGV